MEGDDDEEADGKGERKEELKDGKKEGDDDKDKDTPMEQQTEEDDIDPLDAYMEEVKQEVKKFNIGAMKGNDKVRTKSRILQCYPYCPTLLKVIRISSKNTPELKILEKMFKCN